MDKETIFAVLEDAEAAELINKETMEKLMGLFATRIVSGKAISALKALEQEPREDAISRQAALQCCRNEWEEEVEMRIKSLPPIGLKCGDIAKAFQFGLAFGFGKKYDEMDKVIDEIKKVITPQGKQGGGEQE